MSVVCFMYLFSAESVEEKKRDLLSDLWPKARLNYLWSNSLVLLLVTNQARNQGQIVMYQKNHVVQGEKTREEERERVYIY